MSADPQSCNRSTGMDVICQPRSTQRAPRHVYGVADRGSNSRGAVAARYSRAWAGGGATIRLPSPALPSNKGIRFLPSTYHMDNLGPEVQEDVKERINQIDLKIPKTMISPVISQDILSAEPDITSLRGKNVLITGGTIAVLSFG